MRHAAVAGWLGLALVGGCSAAGNGPLTGADSSVPSDKGALVDAADGGTVVDAPPAPDITDVPTADTGFDAGFDAGFDVGFDAGTDVGFDVGTDVGFDVGVDVPMTVDTPPSCGTARPTVSAVRGTEGLVIAADGTIYYSQSHAVGRIAPGGSPEPAWAALPAAASTVWGIALDAPNHRLFVASPVTRIIYAVDLTAPSPTGVPWLSAAGQPNGLTMGPDGALYYTDFSGGHVYRVTGTTTGTRTRVTTSTINGADGLAFHRDGSLYVEGYNDGTLVKLTLSGNMEAARDVITSDLTAPDGIAFDAMDRIYIGGGGALTRLDADGTHPVVLHGGLSAPANVEFGAGALPCSDIYVATGGAMYRYETGTAAGAAVPWH